jgi:hypothetical protein
MNNESNKHLTVVFPDGETKSRLVDALIRDKPIGWSSRSQATYYKKAFALWIQRDLDKMMVDRKARLYRYDKWSLAPNTLYFRVNQAIAYLTDNMDPDNVYKEFMETVKITREHKVGVLLSFIAGEIDMTEAEAVDKEVGRPKWMERLDAWLEDESARTPFIKEKLMLNDEQVAQLRTELDELHGIMHSITNSQVKVLKV